MKDLLKSFLIYGLGTALGKFISVFLLPIYAAYFSPEDYGNLDLVLTCTTILGAFGMLQIETAFQRFFYDYESLDRKTLCTTALLATIFFSVVFVVIGICLSPIICRLLSIDDMTSLLILSFTSVIPSNIVIILFVIFRFSEKPKVFTILNVFNVLLSLSLTILFVLVFDWNIRGVIFATLLSSSVVMLISFYLCRESFSKRWNLQQAKQMLAFGLPQFPARLGSLSNSYINRFFIVGRFSVYTLGLFSVGLKIASIMMMVQTAMQLSWLPFMYKLIKTDENHKEKLREYINRLIMAILLLCVLISLFSKELVLLLTNSAYIDAYKIVGTISLSYAFYIFKDLVDIGVNVTNKTKYTSYIYFIATFLNILFLYLVPASWDILGVSVAMMMSNLILFLLTLLVSERLYKVNYSLVQIYLSIGATIIITLFLSVFDLSLIIKMIISLTILVMWCLKEKELLYAAYVSIKQKSIKK